MTTRAKVKRVVEQVDTLPGRMFDIVVQALIVISVIDFSLETLPTLSDSTRATLAWIEAVIVSVFVVEYLVRIWVADDRLAFVISPYGIIDLLAFLPALLFVGLDLRAIRVLRLFRLIRILKLVRYTQAARRMGNAFRAIKEELVLFLVATVLLIYLSSVGIYYLEHEAQPEVFASVFHCLWWAVVTLSTVGYGDAFPVTVGGRLFTFVILILGLGIVAVPAGLMASALSRARKDEASETGDVKPGERS